MVLVTIFHFLFCCVNHTKVDNKIETINLDIKTLDIVYLDLSDIAEEVLFINLDSHSGNLLSVINQVEFTDSFIFVHDNNSLFRFDHQGRFINQIGRKGKGPGEYVRIITISLDEKREMIYVLNSTFEILQFTFDGEFTGVKTRIPRINNIYFFNDLLFCSRALIHPQFLRDEENFELTLLSKELVIRTELIPISRSSHMNPMFVFSSNFYSFENNFYYNDPLKDTVYVFEEPNMVPRYLFTKSPGLNTDIKKIFETKRSLLIYFLTESNVWNIAIYDKDLKKTKLLYYSNGLAGFKDNIHKLPVFFPRFQNGNVLIDFISPYQLKASDTLYTSVSQDDNPILRLVRVNL